jgi:hypothetical protein
MGTPTNLPNRPAIVAGPAMAIAWATVFTHARRLTSANPIHALRYE